MFRYIKQGWLVLLLALLFGAALAVVDAKLGPIIDNNKKLARQQAAIEVVPGGATAEAFTLELGGVAATAFRVLDADGGLAGYALPASIQGYADRIELIVGLSADRSRVTDFVTIYSQETPGLGDKIKGDEFHRAFRETLQGRTGRPAAARLTAVKGKQLGEIADGEIVAITGATISSQAVCDAIYDALVVRGALEQLAALDAAAPSSN